MKSVVRVPTGDTDNWGHIDFITIFNYLIWPFRGRHCNFLRLLQHCTAHVSLDCAGAWHYFYCRCWCWCSISRHYHRTTFPIMLLYHSANTFATKTYFNNFLGHFCSEQFTALSWAIFTLSQIFSYFVDRLYSEQTSRYIQLVGCTYYIFLKLTLFLNFEFHTRLTIFIFSEEKFSIYR